MANWWDEYEQVGGGSVAAADPVNATGGNWWESFPSADQNEMAAPPLAQPEIAAPTEDTPSDPMAYYQELRDRQPAGESPEQAYYRNIKRAADMDQGNRGAVTGSAPYRVAEDVVKAGASAIVNPLLSLENKMGVDAAGDMLSQRQAQYDISHARDAGYAEQTIGGIGESLAQFAVLSATGGGFGSALGLGNAGAAALKWATIGTGLGNKSYEDTYRNSINDGKTEDEATKIAAATAALEVGVMAAFQAVGLGGAEKAVADGLGFGAAKGAVSKTSLQGIKKFITQTAGELSEENLTTLTQSLAQTGEVGDWKSYRDTTVQTLGTMGLLSGSQKLINFTENPSRRTAKEAGLDEVATTHKERTELAAKLTNGLTGAQFTEQIKAAATSPDEADALLEIYKARAASAGESFDDYVGSRVGSVEKTTLDSVVRERGGAVRRQGRRGEIDFDAMKDEGLAVIRAFETQSVATLAHETGHLFRRDLAGDDLKLAERWAGARNGNWNRNAEEKFARGFENYLATGKAPTKALTNVFAKFKDWLAGVYGAIKGTAIDVKISPEMRGVFDRLLLPADIRPTNKIGVSSENTAISVGPPDIRPTSARQNVGLETSPPQPEGENGIARDSAGYQNGTVPESTPAPDILSQETADRFRGLANRAVDQRARDANYAVDEAMGVPETRARSVARTEADIRLQSDPVGELQQFLAKIDEADRTKGAIPLTEADVNVYTALIEEAGKDISTPENRQLHAKLQRGFRQGMTEAARLLGTRDPLGVMDPEARKRKSIVDAVTYTPSSDPADAAAMEERYSASKEKLGKQGIDIDDIDSIAADPKKAMVVLDHFRPAAKWSDALYEYWRNSILSGPATHATNIAGNAAFSTWNLGPERAVQAAVNLFARDKRAASFGEFKYLAGGILPGMMRGIRNARQSWSLETSALAEELGRDGAFKVDGPRGAIKGKMGRLVRAFGYRPLLAADEFAKSLTVTMEVGARAYRAGKALDLTGDELQTFIEAQVNDLNSHAWSAAFGKAEELAFQGRRGLVSQKLVGVGNKLRGLPGGKWVVPFLDTPAAIFEEGLKRTPVLGAILDYAESRKSGMNIVDAGMTPTIARQLIAFGGLALLWDAVGGDEPWLTGAESLSDPKNRDVAYRAQPPMSIRIGDQWYSYARIEPFATAIALTADSVKGMQNGKYHKPVTGLLQQAKEKSYLDGLGDAIDAGQGMLEGDFSSAEQWGSKFAASWVPNLYRQTIRAGEGEMDENRMWGKGGDRFDRFINRTGQATQLPGFDSQPRFDIWGRPISYNDMGSNPATSFAFRLLSPVKSKDLSTVEQADLALIRWNEKNPDAQEVYSEVQKFVTIDGETKYLTDEQHAEYAQLAGEQARDMVAQLDFNPDNPTAAEIRNIKKAISKARKMTRDNLLPMWNLN